MSGRLLTLFACVLCAGPLGAVPLWSVERAGQPGVVLLLGSVHLLRAEDQPLPDPVHAAYREATRIVMELDPAELEPAAAQAALARVGVSTPGRSVKESLSADDWRRAEDLARAAGLALQPLAGLEPWYAALALYTGALALAGFDPALGVEQQVAAWAARDGKSIHGLESFEEQLGMFKSLPPEVHRELLLKTLEDLGSLAEDADALVREWRGADLDALGQQLESDFEGYEALRERIVGERNRAWLPELEALAAATDTSLVVVGALHLVGEDGLPALLAARGFTVRWLESR